jgi:hypothetical protein
MMLFVPLCEEVAPSLLFRIKALVRLSPVPQEPRDADGFQNPADGQ